MTGNNEHNSGFLECDLMPPPACRIRGVTTPWILQIKAQLPLETSETTNPLTQHHIAKHLNPQSNICKNSNLRQQNMRGVRQNTNKGSSLLAPSKKQTQKSETIW